MNVLVLLAFLGGGLLAGHLLRARSGLLATNRHLTKWSVSVLLACMGAKMALGRSVFVKDLKVLLLAVGSAALLMGAFFALFALVARFSAKRTAAEAAPGEAPVGAGHELLAVALNAGFILGGFLLFLFLPEKLATGLPVDAAADWLLRLLLLCIGFDLGSELAHLDLRKLAPHLLLVPLVNIVLTLGVAALFAALTRFTVKEGMLVHAGLGWYSLSSLLLAERGLVLLSILAFIHNVFRELFSILLAPYAARISPFLPVYLGGATSMDVMLPFVQAYSGREYTLVSFYSGMVCSFAVIPLVKGLMAL